MFDYKEKSKNITFANNLMLAKTLSMFEYENLPDTMPCKEIEKILQKHGYGFITKHNDELYIFSGSLGGEVDAYGNPTKFTVNNPFLKLNKIFDISEGVLICNDDMQLGTLPIYDQYNTILNENLINFILKGYASRSQILLTASDDKTKQSAEIYLKKLQQGELGVIGENIMFDGLKAVSGSSNSSTTFSHLIEYHQYVKGLMMNEVGINVQFNMKKSSFIVKEIKANEDVLFPFVYNMLSNRLTAFDKVNKMFGTEISVDFGSTWAVKSRELVDGIIDNEPLHSDEPINEPKDEPTDEPTDETQNRTIEKTESEPMEEPINEPSEEPTDEPNDEESNEPLAGDLFLINLDVLDDEEMVKDFIKRLESATAEELIAIYKELTE